jgi:hypothetical protein
MPKRYRIQLSTILLAGMFSVVVAASIFSEIRIGKLTLSGEDFVVGYMLLVFTLLGVFGLNRAVRDTVRLIRASDWKGVVLTVLVWCMALGICLFSLWKLLSVFVL